MKRQKFYVALALALVVVLVAPMVMVALDLGGIADAHEPEASKLHTQGASRWREWTTRTNGTSVQEGHGSHCDGCPTAYWTTTCANGQCSSTFTVDGPPPGGW